jgi:hypothetical protein
MGLLKKSKSINRKGRQDFRQDRKELKGIDLTLRTLHMLCELCG